MVSSGLDGWIESGTFFGVAMHVTCVHVRVKSDQIEAFREASILNHRESIQEPGNHRFDILQSNDDPSLFLLYEAYESEAAAAAHKTTAHYLQWRETVADWMAEPRKGVSYQSVAP